MQDCHELYLKCFPDDVNCAEIMFGLLDKSPRVEITDGELISVAWLVEKPLVFNGKRLTVPHIVGLCTDPEYRYRGYAKRLLERIFSEIKESPFVFLYPFKHSFYEKFGFATVSYDFPSPQGEITPLDAASALSIYKGLTDGLSYYYERDEAQFRFYEEIYRSDGLLSVGCDGGILSPDGYLPPKFRRTDKKGAMARIVNVKSALSLTDADCRLTISDEMIAENNLSLKLKDGKILDCDGGTAADIGELTAAVFGQSERLKDIFPLKSGYIADKY